MNLLRCTRGEFEASMPPGTRTPFAGRLFRQRLLLLLATCAEDLVLVFLREQARFERVWGRGAQGMSELTRMLTNQRKI